MAPISRDDARRLIVELRLPAVVLDIFDERTVPEPLDVMLGCATAYFMLDADEQAVYAPDRLVPILDDGNSGRLLAYDRGRGGFVSFDIEDAVDDPTRCRAALGPKSSPRTTFGCSSWSSRAASATSSCCGMEASRASSFGRWARRSTSGADW